MSSQAVVQGSLGQVAQASGTSLAMAFLGAEICAVVDTSGSMGAHDSRGRRQRYDVAVDELRQLQAKHPGKVVVASFGSECQFDPGGVPTFHHSGTDLAGALRYVRMLDGTVRFVVISDGCPDSASEALAEAGTMQSEVSCIFVGPEDDLLAQEFLNKLARRKGGRFARATAADLLGDKVEAMLLGTGR